MRSFDHKNYLGIAQRWPASIFTALSKAIGIGKVLSYDFRFLVRKHLNVFFGYDRLL